MAHRGRAVLLIKLKDVVGPMGFIDFLSSRIGANESENFHFFPVYVQSESSHLKLGIMWYP